MYTFLQFLLSLMRSLNLIKSLFFTIAFEISLFNNWFFFKCSFFWLAWLSVFVKRKKYSYIFSLVSFILIILICFHQFRYIFTMCSSMDVVLTVFVTCDSLILSLMVTFTQCKDFISSAYFCSSSFFTFPSLSSICNFLFMVLLFLAYPIKNFKLLIFPIFSIAG